MTPDTSTRRAEVRGSDKRRLDGSLKGGARSFEGTPNSKDGALEATAGSGSAGDEVNGKIGSEDGGSLSLCFESAACHCTLSQNLRSRLD